MARCEHNQEEVAEGRDPVCFLAPFLVYLIGTLPDERSELGHHHVHARQTGRFQFADLLFHNGLKGQVRGEEPRSESAFEEEKNSVVL